MRFSSFIFTAETPRTQRTICFCFSLRGRKTKSILLERHRFPFAIFSMAKGKVFYSAVTSFFIQLPLFIE